MENRIHSACLKHESEDMHKLHAEIKLKYYMPRVVSSEGKPQSRAPRTIGMVKLHSGKQDY